MKSDKLKIGIVGVGRFGSRHLEKWLSMDDIEFIGFNDINPNVQQRISDQYGCKFYELDALIEKVDVLDVVVPASFHYAIALKALIAGKHVFIEKPFSETPEEALELTKIATASNLKIGIGHIERFNPVFQQLKSGLDEIPVSVLAFRQGPFIPNAGLDVSIIYELMVHDIDIVRQLIPYPVVNIQASGEILHSDKIDRATAILSFGNGSRAVLFASRAETSRRREILCETSSNAYKANLMERKFQISGQEEQLLGPYDAMDDELTAFIDAVRTGNDHVVNGTDGIPIVEIAKAIEDLILSK